MPTVSIVVPVYNAEKYIERCLNSLISQTFTDIEIILVNDGSEDESKKICEKYCNDDDRIRLINQENQGPDIARKNGVLQAKGEYIMFADADDYVSSDAVEVMRKAIISEAADMVCSQIVRFDDSGKRWSGSKYTSDMKVLDSVDEVMKAYFITGYLLGTYYAKLIKRELIEDYPFIKNSVIGEDISAVLYMLEKTGKVVIIPDRTYYYYWNLDSISHSGYTERHRISLDNYINIRDRLLHKQYVDDKYICGYFSEYEMAVATAMSRSWSFNRDAAHILRQDIKKYWKLIKHNENTAFYMKACMWIYIVSPRIFMILYRIVYLVTGR